MYEKDPREDLMLQKQLPHRGNGYIPYFNRTTYRSSYTGFSNHGFITYFYGEYRFASWNMMSPCAQLADEKGFNNPQCVVETFETYKARILAPDFSSGALVNLLQRLTAGKIGAATLQEAVFLKHSPGMEKVTQDEWNEFREKCEHYITCNGFEILKSDALAKHDNNQLGRGCAILYNKEVYQPINLTNSTSEERGCVSAEDRVYTRLKNIKTKVSLFLTSVHLDYKKTHGEGSKEAIIFAKEFAESFNTKDLVFIMGDWNAPTPKGDKNSFGSKVQCTTVTHSENLDEFVFFDKQYSSAKNYDWVYAQNLGTNRSQFTADIFLPSKDGGMFYIKDGDKYNSNFHIKPVNTFERDYYSLQSYAKALILILPISLLAGHRFVKTNPYLTLVSTAASLALIYCGTDHLIENRFVSDTFAGLWINFKYGTDIVQESHRIKLDPTQIHHPLPYPPEV